MSLYTLIFFLNQIESVSCSKYFGLSNAKYYSHIIHNDYLIGSSTQRENAIFKLACSGNENFVRK